MRIVGRTVLEEFWAGHAGARRPLVAWLAVAEQASWRSIVDVKRTYPHADYVKPFTVFNVKGNTYRLVTLINYQTQLISVDRCMTHAEYDRGDWK